ncbi:MAG: ligase-associated DNA damage response DEXH box helicase [Pseudomonadota bacterium]
MTDLPSLFQSWFSERGWSPHPHQLDLLKRAENTSTLLIAPTGAGKTLSGFLPSLIELAESDHQGLHTLYISPLKALASDIRRNLQTPVDEMGLNIRIEDRTGDTSQTQRKRQRADPPHILLTTPESLALLLSYEDAPRIFKGLQRVVVDEIHALAESKRGDQLMLCLASLQAMIPNLKRIGLSATVEDPPSLAQFLAPHPAPSDILFADPGPNPDISMMITKAEPPWAGAGAVYAVPEVLEEVRKAKTTLIFINTRAQAEIFFYALWNENEGDLPIALHHGSLSREARTKVEAAMVAGELRAIVCTGSLDLGIDWGDVDLVIQIGAPKNVKRLVQRIGRSNHTYNAPSRAIIVPANRFELVECHAALQAVVERDLDGEQRGSGPLDVLCQHILIRVCAGPVFADDLFDELRSAGPYADLTRDAFDQCLDFCATGGYALRAYDKWKRLMQRADGSWGLRDPRSARAIRMNIGTIVDTELLSVRMKNSRGGRPLGEVEEAFAATLSPGDTFLIGGQTVRYEGLREMTLEVTKKADKQPKIAVFGGSKFATSLALSDRVMAYLQNGDWSAMPAYVADWLDLQTRISRMPHPYRLLGESFVRDATQYTCIYGFAGRNAHSTLALLVSKRMEQAGLKPLGFVVNDYALLIWGLEQVQDLAPLVSADGLRDGLELWLSQNAVMKRSFRQVAHVACLIERNLPGQRKSGRQATFSSDILYDTLQKYDPDHLLMKITRSEADRGLVDFSRIEAMLARSAGRIDHVIAPHVTPLAAPLLLEAGRIPISGEGREYLMDVKAEELMAEIGMNGVDWTR